MSNRSVCPAGHASIPLPAEAGSPCRHFCGAMRDQTPLRTSVAGDPGLPRPTGHRRRASATGPRIDVLVVETGALRSGGSERGSTQ